MAAQIMELSIWNLIPSVGRKNSFWMVLMRLVGKQN